MKKRTIALAMAAALTVTAFAGLTACGKNNTPENPVATEETVAGGTINTQNNKASLPEDLQKVFDEAASQAGGSQQAVCYLGSQVVAGTNHAFLTQDTDGAHNFHIMIAYQDLDGKVELKSVSNLDPTAESFGAEADGAEAGGWQIADDCYNNDLPGDAKEAVLDALLTNRDISYNPIAVLGTQVVSGTNYTVLCKVYQHEEGAKPSLQVVHVYQDTSGKTEITDSVPFSIANFNQ